jgi:hypothetical protein
MMASKKTVVLSFSALKRVLMAVGVASRPAKIKNK